MKRDADKTFIIRKSRINVKIIQFGIMTCDVEDLIAEILRRDPVAKFLLDRSDVTQTQLDTYLADRSGRKDGFGLGERIRLRDGKPVKKGAFLRTLKQAHENVTKSVCTVILSEYFGLLGKGDVLGLVRVGDLLASIDNESLSEEQAKRIIEELGRVVGSLEEEGM